MKTKYKLLIIGLIVSFSAYVLIVEIDNYFNGSLKQHSISSVPTTEWTASYEREKTKVTEEEVITPKRNICTSEVFDNEILATERLRQVEEEKGAKNRDIFTNSRGEPVTIKYCYSTGG